jgi:hypothetical protein
MRDKAGYLLTKIKSGDIFLGSDFQAFYYYEDPKGL